MQLSLLLTRKALCNLETALDMTVEEIAEWLEEAIELEKNLIPHGDQ